MQYIMFMYARIYVCERMYMYVTYTLYNDKWIGTNPPEGH